MSTDDRQVRERLFIEEMGVLFDQSGATRMSGRVFGHLLICDPEHQSPAQLADNLGASRGAISMTLQQLQAAMMVERVAVPGQRSTFFRLRSGGWANILRARMGVLAVMRETAARGLAVLEGEPTARLRRLQDFHDFYAYMERRMPELIEEWAQQLPS